MPKPDTIKEALMFTSVLFREEVNSKIKAENRNETNSGASIDVEIKGMTDRCTTLNKCSTI